MQTPEKPPVPQSLSKPCDMGAICLDCQPRGPNGECPDVKTPEVAAEVVDDGGWPTIEWTGDESTFYDRYPIGTKFYAHAPREWKSLEPDEWKALHDTWMENETTDAYDLLVAVELALKERNT